MKNSILLFIFLVSCGVKAPEISSTSEIPQIKTLSANFYFADCEQYRSFMKKIITIDLENDSADSIQFEIDHVSLGRPDHPGTDLIIEECFIGISALELKSIFGKSLRFGEGNSFIVMSSTYLDNLAIEAKIKDSIVVDFRSARPIQSTH